MTSGMQSITALQSVSDHDGPAALVITADESDRLFLAAALEASRWRLHFAKDAYEARAVLAEESVSVVFVDGDSGDSQGDGWRELLERASGPDATQGPRFIIVSRVADDRMWAEVLNLGGYDLLAKPLEAKEVIWVVRSALSGRNGARDWVRAAQVKKESAWNRY